MTTPFDDGIRAIFLQAAELVEDLVTSESVLEHWEGDSALEGYSVAGLAGHLARAVLTVERYLEGTPSRADAPSLDAAGYFVHVLADHDPVASDLHRGIRQRAEQEAAAGPDTLAARLRAARAELTDRLPSLPHEHQVGVLGGRIMTVDEYLRTRLVEMVVHLDDLTVSVDRDLAAGLPPEAFEIVAVVLARMAVRRSGPLATVRSLARRERQPEAVRAL